MRKTSLAILIAVALTAFAQDKPAGQDKTAVMATVHQFVDAFNKGDTKTAAAACADQTSIIDEFPPYEWHGADGCAKWMNDYDAWAKTNNVTDGAVTLGSPRHVDVEGDRAYVVVPADITYKEAGKAVKETGSTFTLALQKDTTGWRIVGWSWAKNDLRAKPKGAINSRPCSPWLCSAPYSCTPSMNALSLRLRDG